MVLLSKAVRSGRHADWALSLQAGSGRAIWSRADGRVSLPRERVHRRRHRGHPLRRSSEISMVQML